MTKLLGPDGKPAPSGIVGVDGKEVTPDDAPDVAITAWPVGVTAATRGGGKMAMLQFLMDPERPALILDGEKQLVLGWPVPGPWRGRRPSRLVLAMPTENFDEFADQIEAARAMVHKVRARVAAGEKVEDTSSVDQKKGN